METKTLDRAWDLAHFGDIEAKSIRKVRTSAGQKRYGQPIGSVIIRDRKLNNVKVLDPVWDGWDLAQGPDGKKYDVGYDDETGKWIATHHNHWGKVVASGDNEEDVWKGLDDALGKPTNVHGKQPTTRRKLPPSNGGGSEDGLTFRNEQERTVYRQLPATQKRRYREARKLGWGHRGALSQAHINVNKPVQKPSKSPVAQRAAATAAKKPSTEMSKGDLKKGTRVVATDGRTGVLTTDATGSKSPTGYRVRVRWDNAIGKDKLIGNEVRSGILRPEPKKRGGSSPKGVRTSSGGTETPKAGGRRTPAKPSSRSNSGTTVEVDDFLNSDALTKSGQRHVRNAIASGELDGTDINAVRKYAAKYRHTRQRSFHGRNAATGNVSIDPKDREKYKKVYDTAMSDFGMSMDEIVHSSGLPREEVRGIMRRLQRDKLIMSDTQDGHTTYHPYSDSWDNMTQEDFDREFNKVYPEGGK